MRQILAVAMAAFSLAACGASEETATDNGAVEGPDRAEIRVVGSSTVYPFAQKVIETFEAAGGAKVMIESSGTDAGLVQFCQGRGMDTPDILNASRQLTPAELETCKKNGVKDIIEAKIGSDGIVIAQARSAQVSNFSFNNFYEALAQTLPTSEYDCTPRPNTYKKWSEVDTALPDKQIVIHGPPKTSGTRDVFLQIAMERGAKRIACLDAQSNTDNAAFVKVVHALREDGVWVDSGENDADIVQKLKSAPGEYGVFGYSFLEGNKDSIQAVTINNVEPTAETIASGKYRLARPLFIYIKKSHISRLPAIKTYASAFMAEDAIGDAGYLSAMGLVPLPAEERAKGRAAVESETAVGAPPAK